MTEDSDEDDDLWDPAGRENSKPDDSVTPKLFMQWRSPRFGAANPDRMNNPVWEWLVRCRTSAYVANEWFKGLSACDAGPGWCFRRFGQTKTKLPDGRIVLVGGEHEDFYDPDFYIYNDVVIKRPDAEIEIYGYPAEVFPPTDFHSATLVDDRIIIIGCLGYTKQRKPRATPVYALDLRNFRIGALNCTGTPPGWLHRHSATYLPEDNSILITGGLIETGDGDRVFPENIDDWKLHLSLCRWERLTRRQWKRWDLRREDGKSNELFWIGSACRYRGGSGKLKEIFDEELEKLVEKLGFAPDFDVFGERYRPPVPHEKIPDNENEFCVYRINVNGVTVRYNEERHSVRVTIEGDLPTATAEAIVSDLQNKLSLIERRPYELIRL